MPKFSKQSLEKLETCCKPIQIIMIQAIKYYDFTILEGYRDKQRQEQYFKEEKTQLHYPHSKHNQKPSLAIDIAPYPIDFFNINRYILLAQIIHMIAIKGGFLLFNGGYWKDLKDYGHWEFRGYIKSNPDKEFLEFLEKQT